MKNILSFITFLLITNLGFGQYTKEKYSKVKRCDNLFVNIKIDSFNVSSETIRINIIISNGSTFSYKIPSSPVLGYENDFECDFYLKVFYYDKYFLPVETRNVSYSPIESDEVLLLKNEKITFNKINVYPYYKFDKPGIYTIQCLIKFFNVDRGVYEFSASNVVKIDVPK